MMSMSRMIADLDGPRKNPAMRPSAMPGDDRHGDDGGSDQQRQSSAVDEARENVAPDRVRAERIGPRASCLPTTGGFRNTALLVRSGGYGAMTGARIATDTIAMMKISPRRPPWLALK
jgi:hypothetical protein